MRPATVAFAMASLPLAGCHSLADVAGGTTGGAGTAGAGSVLGAVTGTAAAVGSGNPALGVVIGIGAQTAADWGIRTVARRWRRTEQDALAAAAGTMEVGEVRPWQVRHDLPVGNEGGEVRVLRAIETPLARCKEVLFSVDSGSGPDATRQWFVTSVCRGAEGWKWAAAEPAAERWGSLQ